MGVLKEKSTIIIAVWGSILLHTVFLLGFGLAFSDKRNNFPEPEPRFVTLLSVSPVLKQSQEHDFSKENVPAKVTEKVVYDKPEPVKKKLPSETIPEESVSKEVTGSIGIPADRGITSDMAGKNKEILKTEEPSPVRKIIPEYPFRARKMGIEGDVTLDVVVSEKGFPVSCQVVNSSGDKDLDAAAVKAVTNSRFYPGTINGGGIQSSVRIHIRFQLHNS